MPIQDANPTRETALSQSNALNRVKDRLLAQLAHDMRNMASTFAGAVHLAEIRGSFEHLQKAQRGISAQVLESVLTIENVIEFSRLLSDEGKAAREQVMPDSIVTQAVKTAQPALQARNQTLEVSGSDLSATVEAAPRALERNVLNLLLAASSTAGPNTSLGVRVRREGRFVEIGIDFPAEQVAAPSSVESCLAELESATSAGFAPALCVCAARGAVEREGDAVELLPAGEGQWQYVMRLPATVDATGATETPTTAAGPGSLRVLLVDDNADTVNSLAALLRLKGHEAHTESEGPGAIEAALRLLPDAILLDLGLPRMDGFEVVAELRRHEELRDTLIVAVSGYGDALTIERAIGSGFNHHLVKPVDISRLLRLLDEVQPRHTGRP